MPPRLEMSTARPEMCAGTCGGIFAFFCAFVCATKRECPRDQAGDADLAVRLGEVEQESEDPRVDTARRDVGAAGGREVDARVVEHALRERRRRLLDELHDRVGADGVRVSGERDLLRVG